MSRTSVALCLLLSACASQPKIGDIIHPAIGEFGSTGTCVGGPNEPCAFSISIFAKDSAPKFVASLKFIERDEAGKPLWKIIDKASLPTDMSEKFVRYDACRNNQSPGDSVVTVVNYYGRNVGEFVKAAGWAYKVELPSGRLVAINADAVECLAQVGDD